MDAKVIVHKDYVISNIDNRIYGSFLEHIGRAIYTGIYEPDHPTADNNGFREDVIRLVKSLNTPICRYPGGNFVSAYNWEDGIGPREDRPVRLDLAWHSSESNQVGIDEFCNWCETVGTELMLAVNLGSKGLDEARNLLEYCNHSGGSYYSDLRKKNGRESPWNIKTWCLGNEMDGDWQIGHKTAEEYGKLAANTARAMKNFDDSLELIACGSSHPKMPSFPEWDATVLEETYEHIDYISLHTYFGQLAKKETTDFLSLNLQMENFIDTLAGTISYVKAKKRSKNNVYISFDEWNCWYHSREKDKKILSGQEGWPYHPNILEDIYNFEDLLMVGCALNSFIRKSDVVKIACIAQLVNAIAPIMTEKGGRAWRQTTYYPFEFASNFGRGKALDLKVSSPSYDNNIADNISYLDIAAVENKDKHISFFAINRHPEESIEASINLYGYKILKIDKHLKITNSSLLTTNSSKSEKIKPVIENNSSHTEDKLYFKLIPHSYNLVRIVVGVR